MPEHDKPTDKGASLSASTSQDSNLPKTGGDPVANAEEHLSGVDMAAQRAILKQMTK